MPAASMSAMSYEPKSGIFSLKRSRQDFEDQDREEKEYRDHCAGAKKHMKDYRKFQEEFKEMDMTKIGIDGIEDPVEKSEFALLKQEAIVEDMVEANHDEDNENADAASDSTDEESDTDNIKTKRARKAANRGKKKNSRKRRGNHAGEEDDQKNSSNATAREVQEAQLRQLRSLKPRELADQLLKFVQTHLQQEHHQRFRQIFDVLQAKYLGKPDTTSYRVQNRNVKHPYRKKEFLNRFQGSEEEQHPWLTCQSESDIPQFLFRVYDENSQCQIKDPAVGLLSGSAAALFTTYDNRRLGLGDHANRHNTRKTGFISYTSSITEIMEREVPTLKERQMVKRLPVEYCRVTVLNVKARLENRKPILRMKDELIYYDVKHHKYAAKPHPLAAYENEYLLPFSVSVDEIVCTWAIRDIEEWMKSNKATSDDWVQDVVSQAYKKHEAGRQKAMAVLPSEQQVTLENRLKQNQEDHVKNEKKKHKKFKKEEDSQSTRASLETELENQTDTAHTN